MVGSGYGSSVAWGALASAAENVHLQSETKVYEATLACDVESNLKKWNILYRLQSIRWWLEWYFKRSYWNIEEEELDNSVLKKVSACHKDYAMNGLSVVGHNDRRSTSDLFFFPRPTPFI
jgi:hypothetical protein